MSQTYLAIGFSRKYVAVILAAISMAYALAILFIVDIARIQDVKSRSQTQNLVRMLIEQKTKWLERTLVDYADWGAAYQHLHHTVNPVWAYDQDNFGKSLANGLSIEYAAVFDPDGKEVYSVVDGELTKGSVVSKIGGVKELVTRARATQAREVATGLLIAEGGLVLAVASILSAGSDSSVKLDSRNPSVVVFGDRLTDSDIGQLRDSLGLNSLRLVPAGPGVREADVFLRTDDGRVAFVLDAETIRPGEEMLRAILPSFGLVGVMFAGLLLWLARQGVRVAGTVQDAATALQAAHRAMERKAHYDVVTGLANRAKFTLRLQEALQTRDKPVSVLFIDLDRFKPVNDTHGHDAGDFVLRLVGERLKAIVKPDDLCARLGGDEFVVMSFDSDEAAIRRLCKGIIAAISADISYGEHTINIGASIGIAQSRPGNDALEDVLRRADLALYEAKTAGRSSYRWWTEASVTSVRISA